MAEEACIFISHKLDDKPSDDFLKALRPKIEALDYQVLIDTDIAGGENWKAELSTWMGMCSCALILLSRKAITESEWIFQEASILNWRAERDCTFKLIPVIVEVGLKPAEVNASRFKDVIDLTRFQFPGRNGTMKKRVAGTEKILSDFRPEQRLPKTPQGLAVFEVQKILDQAQPPSFTAAETALGVDLSGWRPGWPKSLTFALELVGSGPYRLVEALEALQIAPRLRGEILRHALPFWVDEKAALAIRDWATGGGATTLMMINTGSRKTVEAYVQRAAQVPGNSWKAYSFTGVFGEDFVGDVWDEICQCICLALGDDPGDPAGRKEKVKNLAAVLQSANIPQFVSIDATSRLDWNLLGQLCHDHGELFYLVRIGHPYPPKPTAVPVQVETVLPEINPDAESKADGAASYMQLQFLS